MHELTTAQLIGFFLAALIPSFTTLAGILFNNSRLSDLRAHMDSRFTGSDTLFTERLRRVEEVMDARLTRIENGLKLR